MVCENPDRERTEHSTRAALACKPPPPGMLIAIADDLAVLISFNIKPDDSKAIRQLLEDAIRTGRKKVRHK